MIAIYVGQAVAEDENLVFLSGTAVACAWR
jgi:hypothetical protein